MKSVLQTLFSIEPKSCPLSVSGGVQLYKREKNGVERDKNIADIPFFLTLLPLLPTQVPKKHTPELCNPLPSYYLLS